MGEITVLPATKKFFQTADTLERSTNKIRKTPIRTRWPTISSILQIRETGSLRGFMQMMVSPA